MHYDYPLADNNKSNLIILQSALLAYLTIVLFHFFSFAICKPKINNSLQEWRCIRLKYVFGWAILVAVALAIQYFSFTLIWPISDYYGHWLDVLDQIKEGYSCTSESIYVNVELLKVMYDTSDQNKHIFACKVIWAFQVLLILLQYCMNLRLILRWYYENPK